MNFEEDILCDLRKEIYSLLQRGFDRKSMRIDMSLDFYQKIFDSMCLFASEKKMGEYDPVGSILGIEVRYLLSKPRVEGFDNFRICIEE